MASMQAEFVGSCFPECGKGGISHAIAVSGASHGFIVVAR